MPKASLRWPHKAVSRTRLLIPTVGWTAAVMTTYIRGLLTAREGELVRATTTLYATAIDEALEATPEADEYRSLVQESSAAALRDGAMAREEFLIPLETAQRDLRKRLDSDPRRTGELGIDHRMPEIAAHALTPGGDAFAKSYLSDADSARMMLAGLVGFETLGLDPLDLELSRNRSSFLSRVYGKRGNRATEFWKPGDTLEQRLRRDGWVTWVDATQIRAAQITAMLYLVFEGEFIPAVKQHFNYADDERDDDQQRFEYFDSSADPRTSGIRKQVGAFRQQLADAMAGQMPGPDGGVQKLS